MAALDVHRVKSGPLGQRRGLAELLSQRLEVVVGGDAGVVRRAVLLQLRVAVGDDGRGPVAGVGVAAAVVGLEDQVGGEAVGLQSGPLDRLGEPLVLGQVFFVQQQLGLGGTALLHDGDGLEPDHGAAPPGLVHIAAGGELRRRAVGQGVRPLHGGHAQAVGELPPPHRQRPGQDTGVPGKGEVHPQRGGGGLDLVQRLVMESLVRHDRSLLFRFAPRQPNARANSGVRAGARTRAGSRSMSG